MTLFKRNFLIYFYGYLVIQVIYIYINVYLPIYFFNIIKINRRDLALIQLFSYSALLIKPLMAIYFDKTKSKIKLMFIICSIGFFLSFVMVSFTLSTLIYFGIFLCINLIFGSLLDVIIDKLIVVNTPDLKTMEKNAMFSRIGALFGAIYPNLIFLIIFKDIYRSDTWDLFFLIGIFTIFPIIIIGFFINSGTILEESIQNIPKDNINRKNILLMCVIWFLIYAEKLYEYPLEPFILEKYGEENFSLFVFFFIIIILIHSFSVIIAGLVSDKFHRKKLLLTSIISYGILMCIAPFTDMFTFFIIFGIMQIFFGFISINLVVYTIEFSKKKVIYYQLMSTAAILASIVFIPLGTYLSSLIDTEYLILAAGLILILTIIPTSYLEDKSS
jgi:hypothetical protein